jgi:hypothetical protein
LSIFTLSHAIKDLETSAELLLRAAQAISAWDDRHDAWKEEQTARELYFKALSLRLLLETEKRERVLH